MARQIFTSLREEKQKLLKKRYDEMKAEEDHL